MSHSKVADAPKRSCAVFEVVQGIAVEGIGLGADRAWRIAVAVPLVAGRDPEPVGVCIEAVGHGGLQSAACVHCQGEVGCLTVPIELRASAHAVLVPGLGACEDLLSNAVALFAQDADQDCGPIAERHLARHRTVQAPVLAAVVRLACPPPLPVGFRLMTLTAPPIVFFPNSVPWGPRSTSTRSRSRRSSAAPWLRPT